MRCISRCANSNWRALPSTGQSWATTSSRSAPLSSLSLSSFTSGECFRFLYFKIYVDGVLKNSLLAFNDITINGFDLGGITGYSNFFNGSISAMRIYNRAITSEEVALIYDFERN